MAGCPLPARRPWRDREISGGQYPGSTDGRGGWPIPWRASTALRDERASVAGHASFRSPCSRVPPTPRAAGQHVRHIAATRARESTWGANSDDVGLTTSVTSPRPAPTCWSGRNANAGPTQSSGAIHRGEAGPPPATSADVRPHARALMTHVGSTAPSCSTCSVSAPRSRSDGRRGRSRRGSGRSSCWHHATPVPSCGRRIAPCRVWPLDPGWRPALRPALGTVAVRRLLARLPRRSPCRSSCSARAR